MTLVGYHGQSKDFELIAKILRNADARAIKLFGVSLAGSEMATICRVIAWGIKEERPRFNTDLFLHKCGMHDGGPHGS